MSSKSIRSRYRTLAPISHVDETLFGGLKPRPSDKRPNSTASSQVGETVQIVTIDDLKERKCRMERPQLNRNKERMILEDREAVEKRRKNQLINAESVKTKEQRREKKELEREEEQLIDRLRAQKTTLRAPVRQEEEKLRQKVLRKTLQQQVKEREFSATSKRNDIFLEADQLMIDDLQRRMRLNEIQEETLMELRAIGIPEKYCRKVAVFPRTQSQQCQEKLNLPFRFKHNIEADLRPTCLPPISKSAKGTVCKPQRPSVASPYTRLPPI